MVENILLDICEVFWYIADNIRINTVLEITNPSNVSLMMFETIMMHLCIKHTPALAFNDNIPQYRMHNDDKCATQKFSYQNNVCIFA